MALNQRQLRTVPLFIQADSIEDAARQAGISKNTLHRWLNQEEFQKAISEARRRLLDKALHRLSNICLKAVNTLGRLLTAESEAVARAAANDILGHALKQREILDIEERLKVLEKIVLERKT